MYAVYPQVKDNINADSIVKEYNDLLGNPQKILNGPEQVAAVRQQEAAAAQKQQQMAEMAQMAESAGKAAPAAQVLQNTDVGGGQNVLGKLMGAGQ